MKLVKSTEQKKLLIFNGKTHGKQFYELFTNQCEWVYFFRLQELEFYD